MSVEHYCSSVQDDRWRQWQTCDGVQNEDGGGELDGEVQTRVGVIGEVERGGDFCGRLDVHGIYARLYPSGTFWWDLALAERQR